MTWYSRALLGTALLVGCGGLLLSQADEPQRPVFPQVIDTQATPNGVTMPQEALAKITLPRGFQATLFAHEPDIQQPIALATDARGRLWVAENYTYAESAKNFDLSMRDRIVILEDTDHDGRHDRRTVFWDQGQKLASIEIGFGGVWALCAPQLLFIPDRDGDDRPDGEPEVVLDGFNDANIRHNIVNGLRWGPDGWLYGRHGILSNSYVGPPGTAPDDRVRFNASIWRYHPQRQKVEIVAQGTTNPWGMDWDDHGQMFFINTVIGHLWHVVPGASYQRMYGEHFDPYLYQLITQTADHYHWDTREAWSDIRKSGVTPTTDEAGGGHAHSGLMIYLGDNWPERYRHTMFTVNLHGQRLNNDRLERHGATYVGKHAADFMRSTDPFFRAVELIYGPDGGVYLADWSDIGECHENDGVHRSSGRIFKITHGSPEKPTVGDLAKLDDRALVALHTHRNDWYVRQARRLLSERSVAGRDMSAARAALHELYQTALSVPHKLRAMWSLYQIGGADEAWLLTQLNAADEHLRTWAVQLLVDRGAPSAAARQAFIDRARDDESGLVLVFLASALQRIEKAERWSLADALAARSEFAHDPVLPLMIWYGVQGAIPEHIERAVKLVGATPIPLVRRFAARRIMGLLDHQRDAVATLVRQLPNMPEGEPRRDVLGGMNDALRGWRKAKQPDGWAETQTALAIVPDPQVEQLLRELSVVFGDGRAIDDLRRIATDKKEDMEARRNAVRRLVESRSEGIVPLLQSLLGERDLAIDVIRALSAFDAANTPQILLDNYRRLFNQAKVEVVNTLASRVTFAQALLAAVEKGTVDRQHVTTFQVRQMRSFNDAQINTRLDLLWPELKGVSAAKEAKMVEYKQQLTSEWLAQADRQQGRLLYQRGCANCHVLFGEGGKVGPDLTGAQRHNIDYLLENIVDPSRTVQPAFRVSTIVLSDGRVLNGIVGNTTGRTVSVQLPNEKLVIERDQIEETHETPLSLMPEGQLDVLKREQVRDLIAYLMSSAQVPLPSGTTQAGGK